MSQVELTDEWLTMQAALAFGGFVDAAETERVTLWAAEEIESLRRQLAGAVTTLREYPAPSDDSMGENEWQAWAERHVAWRSQVSAILRGQ